jgi:tRNA A37 methylthiotransferase MiaB
VPLEEKKRRSRELRGLSEALSRRHRAAKLGTAEAVLVDVGARADELYSDGLLCTAA